MKTKRTISEIELNGFTRVSGFDVTIRTRKRSVTHKQSARTNKAHRMIKAETQRDAKPDQFMKQANEARRKETRAQAQRDARRAKRNK